LKILKWTFADHDEFAKRTFIKDDVYKALRLGHTQARDDAKLFANLRYADKVRAWIKEPEGRFSERFGEMKISEFKKYLKMKQSKGKDKLVEGKGKKRQRSKGSSDEGELVKLKKGKGKQGKEDMLSDALDDSEQESD
jgi:hypothetical protein